jgi:hypothetical protein
MKCNVGKIDRILRIVVGLGIISLGIIMQSWLGVIGIVPIFTGVMSWCPGYVPLGISTNK